MEVELQFRTVSGTVYKLQVNPDQTVQEVKQMLHEKHGLDAESIKIILSAKILGDDQKIADLKIPPGAYLIIHTGKKRQVKPAENPQPPAQPPTQPPTQPPAQPEPVPAPAPAPAPAPQPVPAPAPAPGPAPTGQPGDPANFQELVSNLIELGFEKSQCEQALRLSQYDVERAGNILLTGDIPTGGDQGFGQGGFDQGGFGQGGFGQGSFGQGGFGQGGYYPTAPTDNAPGAIFGQFQPVYDTLTAEEKQSVQRLLQYSDPITVIQMFMACDRNEANTAALLH